MNRALRFAAAMALALACATTANAGTTGAIAGRVVDDAGRPLAGAAVILSAPSGRYDATTDAHGRYQILSIYPDRYDVRVIRSGNLSWRAVPVDIHADQTTTCNVHLDRVIAILGAMSPQGNAVVPCSFLTAPR